MNVIWIVADTLRRDHLGCYGNPSIRTPALDSLAAKSVRFDAHYAAGFPTMPTRADHATGRWTISLMGWEPLPDDLMTLAQLLSGAGYHTAAITDTPFYLRQGMNYDRGFQTFVSIPGQGAGAAPNWFMGREVQEGFTAMGQGHHESWDVRDRWRLESDRNTPRTMTAATEWLELHYKEDFFLYVDTWDPHEPWDAPSYYTELYMPGFDGEVVDPIYARWQDDPGLSWEKIDKAHAAYCGEITMVNTRRELRL